MAMSFVSAGESLRAGLAVVDSAVHGDLRLLVFALDGRLSRRQGCQPAVRQLVPSLYRYVPRYLGTQSNTAMW